MLTIFSLSLLAEAASVTVSPGDDLTTLTSSLQPGDVVLFNPGIYLLESTIYWSGVGTEDAPITLRASDEGEEVVLQTSGGGWVTEVFDSAYLTLSGLTFESSDPEYTQPSGLHIAGANMNVTVENCVVRNVYGTGLRIEGNGTGLVIRHNEVHSTIDGSGIYVGTWDGAQWLQSSTITNNLVHDVQGTGIYLSNGSQGVTLSDNVVFTVRDDGIYLGSTNFGPENHVIGNAVWQTGYDGLHVEGTSLIQNNIVFLTGEEGIETVDNEDFEGLTAVHISHNTFALTGGWAAYLGDFYDQEGMVFSNNALANPTGYGMWWDDRYEPETSYGYNGYYETQTTNYITNNVVTGLVDGFDPFARPDFILLGGGVADFVDIELFDFYPSPSSLLRNAGDANGEAYIPAVDFNGTPRNGAAPTVGAYEYDAEGNPGWVLGDTFKVVQPGGDRSDSALSTGCCGGGGSTSTTQAAFLLPFLTVMVGRRRIPVRNCQTSRRMRE